MTNRKIWTAEDPIEITQSGLSQAQVNPRGEYGGNGQFPGLLQDQSSARIAIPVGCPACAHTGYRGRFGLYEWMRVIHSKPRLHVAS